ncbi:hypothetical protein AS850_04000 [Frondihabitans sp. 762G35]|uniref:DUF6264 family protein n=1 Tax=Frondihabitans sp. 762G35 TaxID=1446794 RepID=UPI000D225AA5|nr:DUF6264 family protein [Frondihabitans sp. 762G35]ARC56237.1 hypothetical protein AS850_04000 [Frondihabitans sp. 762G35]
MSDEPRYGERIDPRPAPKYGEYAPPGWVSPVAPPEADVAQEPRSDAPASGTVPPPTSAPRQQGPAGRYDAPPPTGSPVPGPAPVVRRGSANGMATVLLLVLGLFRVISDATAVPDFASTFIGSFRQYGYIQGDFGSTDTLQKVGATAAAVAVVLFLLVAVWSLRRLRAGRRSWHVLLIAGVAYNVVVGVVVVAVMMGDPSFVGVAAASGR